MAIELWIEKHRPKTLDEYVWRDPQMRVKVEEWIAQGGLPHLLLSGVSGTGKTSLALLLLRVMEIPSEDILKINASRERTIEKLQDKIVNFVNAWAFNKSGLKYILLDEADKLSQHAQGLLRNEMETYANSCRFLMTCNYPNKIIPALHSRLQEIKFTTLDAGDFITRAGEVLITEGVTFTEDNLMAYHTKTYPDLRKCLGLLHQNTVNGVLQAPREDDSATADYLLEAVELFKKNRFMDARKMILAQADPEDYDSLYRWLYQNVALFGKTDDLQDDALMVIKKGLLHDGQVADREINLASCLAELSRIATPNV